MIRIVLLAFTFGSSAGSPSRRAAEPPSRRVAPDKVMHFAMGTFTQSVGYGTVRILGGSTGLALGVATAGSATAAGLKERHDRGGSGTVSLADAVWTMAGAAAISPLLAQTSR